MKNVNTRVGLGNGIVQRSQQVYKTVSGSIDPIVRDNGHGLWRLGRGTLMGNKEHKLQVNLELTHLKSKVKSRVCLRFLSETRGITCAPSTLLPRNQIHLF